MKCVFHQQAEALSICNHCGRFICAECLLAKKNESYCRDCFEGRPPQVERRSCHLAAILSFIIPGAGQFYNGEPAKGVLVFLSSFLIMPWVLGIIDAYHGAKRINSQGCVFKPKKGCFIAFIICSCVVIGLVFLAGIIGVAFLAGRTGFNDTVAREGLMQVSASLEEYHNRHGYYPENIADLAQGRSGLQKDYLSGKEAFGYFVSFELAKDGYTLVARPAGNNCGRLASKVFTVTTGRKLSSRECSK